MQRRIFIAINLPDNVKKKLQEYQREWADLPVRFTKKDSLHLTVLFIGYVNDEQTLDICRNIREIGKKHQPFELGFNRICLGPSGKSPRLIWLEGKKSEALVNLKRDIEGIMALGQNDSRALAEIEKELKVFVPHITLARIRQIEWRKLETSPQIDKDISISIPVNSIEVMESELKKGGVEYTILESAALTG
jgi:2'-5' RNA ligase